MKQELPDTCCFLKQRTGNSTNSFVKLTKGFAFQKRINMKRVLLFFTLILTLQQGYSQAGSNTYQFMGGYIGTHTDAPGTVPAGLDVAIIPTSVDSNQVLSSVTVGDLDNDGDLDFISGSQKGKLLYYKNTGTPTSPNWVLTPLATLDAINIAPGTTSNEVRPELVDVDNDGDLDLLVGSRYSHAANLASPGSSDKYSEDVIQFINTGTKTNPIFTYTQLTLTGNVVGLHNNLGEFTNLDFVDIDNDGDLDLISQGSDSIAFAENIGTKFSPNFVRKYNANNPFDNTLTGVTDSSTLVSQPEFVDLDKDGDLDMYYIQESGAFVWRENKGTATTPNFIGSAPQPMETELGTADIGSFGTIAFGDYNGDGVLDVLASNFNKGYFAWFKGVGSSPSLTTTDATSITEISATIAGNITSDNGKAVTARGFVYALTTTNSNPKISGTGVIQLTDGSGMGTFDKIIIGLTLGTQYSYAAYATNENGTSYGAVKTFITSSKPFITVWKTTAANESITIPINAAYQYNYTVDWGDDTTKTGITGVATHSYTTAGMYTVKITGDFPAIYFNYVGDRDKIIDIQQWGDIQWKGMDSAFKGCSNLNSTAIDTPNLVEVTSLENMFGYAFTFNGNISDWDVSSVTDMSFMFDYAIAFNQPLIWGEKTSKVTNMARMFSRTSAFNQDISAWDVSSVTDMSEMFSRTSAFNQDISEWNVSSVTDMSGMFVGATAFNKPLNWGGNTSKVTNMTYMFSEASSFNQDISAWNVSSVINMSSMFSKASSFNQDISGWDVSTIDSMSGLFNYSALSIKNYDKLLNSWSKKLVKNNGYLGARGISFCEGEQGRNELIAKGWEITDAGKNCSPTLMSTIPSNNATDIALNSNLELTFSESIKVGTGYVFIKKTSDDSTIAKIDITDTNQVSISVDKLIINPIANLPSNIDVYVWVDATAITDLEGTSFEGIADKTVFRFKTLHQIPPTITFNNSNKFYGDANFELSAASNSLGIIRYAIVGSNTTGTTLSGTYKKMVNLGNVGSIIIRATQVANGIYAASTKDITVTIGKATLTVTAVDKSRNYGSENPVFTMLYSGFKNGDTVSDLTTVPTVSSAATPTSNAGAFAILVSGGAATNYSLISDNGLLTIVTVLSKVITKNATSITADTAVLNGEVISTGGEATLARGFVYSSSHAIPDINDTKVMSGTGIGSFTKNISGLSNKTNYYVRAFSTNYKGISYGEVRTVFIADVTPPNAPVITSVSEYSCDGEINSTADNTLILFGTAEPDVMLSVYVDFVFVGSIKADGSGNWTFDYSTVVLSDADYIFTAKATNAANKTSEQSEEFHITISTLDTDNDGDADFCDQDDDNDGVDDQDDNSPLIPNPDQHDIDGDGIADVEEDCDNDGIINYYDTDSSTCTAMVYQKKKYGFSPNNDGINDTWTIKNIELYPNNKVRVFNRAGILIYEQKGYRNTWNGISNINGGSQKVPVGPYLFIIELNTGVQKTVQGWIYVNY